MKSKLQPKRNKVSVKAWYVIGGREIYLRSSWEWIFARYLECLKRSGCIKEWEYEPETFWFENIKRGVRSYKPDFKVTSFEGKETYYEIKGYLDAKSNTKIKRFRKYYPKHELKLIDKEKFEKIKEDLINLEGIYGSE